MERRVREDDVPTESVRVDRVGRLRDESGGEPLGGVADDRVERDDERRGARDVRRAGLGVSASKHARQLHRRAGSVGSSSTEANLLYVRSASLRSAGVRCAEETRVSRATTPAASVLFFTTASSGSNPFSAPRSASTRDVRLVLGADFHAVRGVGVVVVPVGEADAALRDAHDAPPSSSCPGCRRRRRGTSRPRRELGDRRGRARRVAVGAGRVRQAARDRQRGRERRERVLRRRVHAAREPRAGLAPDVRLHRQARVLERGVVQGLERAPAAVLGGDGVRRQPRRVDVAVGGHPARGGARGSRRRRNPSESSPGRGGGAGPVVSQSDERRDPNKPETHRVKRLARARARAKTRRRRRNDWFSSAGAERRFTRARAARGTRRARSRCPPRAVMFEPCIVKKDLQYSCDLCGELPILGRRWCCDVCEDLPVRAICRPPPPLTQARARASRRRPPRGSLRAGVPPPPRLVTRLINHPGGPPRSPPVPRVADPPPSRTPRAPCVPPDRFTPFLARSRVFSPLLASCKDVCEAPERGLQMGERGQSHPGPHQPGHAMKPFEPTETHAPVHRGKLRDVAEDAVQRWFCDALRCAKTETRAKLRSSRRMLKSGYGCSKDADEARYWKQVARNAGARRIEASTTTNSRERGSAFLTRYIS